jgi:hypothetical protein
MVLILVFAALFLATLVLALASGLAAALSGRDWLLVMGLAALAASGAVLVYWSGVRRWVSRGNHPFTLRQLTAFGGVMAWILTFGLLSWFRAPTGAPLGLGVLLALLVFLILAAALLGVAFRTRRRFRGL